MEEIKIGIDLTGRSEAMTVRVDFQRHLSDQSLSTKSVSYRLVQLR